MATKLNRVSGRRRAGAAVSRGRLVKKNDERLNNIRPYTYKRYLTGNFVALITAWSSG